MRFSCAGSIRRGSQRRLPIGIGFFEQLFVNLGHFFRRIGRRAERFDYDRIHRRITGEFSKQRFRLRRKVSGRQFRQLEPRGKNRVHFFPARFQLAHPSAQHHGIEFAFAGEQLEFCILQANRIVRAEQIIADMLAQLINEFCNFPVLVLRNLGLDFCFLFEVILILR